MYKDITIEIIGGFFALLIMLKILGKTQFSQITPFDFITALVLGDFVGNAIFDSSAGLKEILFSIFIWGVLIYIIELLTQKSTFFRLIFEGKPTMIVYKGEILYKQLKKNYLDINQLQHLMRQHGFFSIYEAEYVILERDGQISIAPKHTYGPPTKQDLGIPNKQTHLPVAVIMDGKVILKNLKEAGYDELWLKNQLSKRKIKDYKEVFYAEWQENRGLEVTIF